MSEPSTQQDSGVSTIRLYLLRATYLLISAGLAIMIWPGIISPSGDMTHFTAVVRSFLGALSLLALLGIRYPLTMLPLLLFELVWKSIWLVAFAIPRSLSGNLDAAMQSEFSNYVVSVVLVAAVLPWTYVFKQYVKAQGDRWREGSA